MVILVYSYMVVVELITLSQFLFIRRMELKQEQYWVDYSLMHRTLVVSSSVIHSGHDFLSHIQKVSPRNLHLLCLFILGKKSHYPTFRSQANFYMWAYFHLQLQTRPQCQIAALGCDFFRTHTRCCRNNIQIVIFRSRKQLKQSRLRWDWVNISETHWRRQQCLIRTL